MNSNIGYCVFWNISKKHVDFDRLFDIMSHNGFNYSFLNDETRKRKFIDSVKKVCSTFGMEMFRIKDHNKEIMFDVIDKAINEKEELVVKECAQIGFLKGDIYCDGDDGIITLFNEEFNSRKSNFSTSKLRLLFTKILKYFGSIPLKKSGGVYFIPEMVNNDSLVLQKLRNVFECLSIGELLWFPMNNDDSTKDVIGKCLFYDFFKEMDILEDKIDTIKKQKCRLKIHYDSLKRMERNVCYYKKLILDDNIYYQINERIEFLFKKVVDKFDGHLINETYQGELNCG